MNTPDDLQAGVVTHLQAIAKKETATDAQYLAVFVELGIFSLNADDLKAGVIAYLEEVAKNEDLVGPTIGEEGESEAEAPGKASAGGRSLFSRWLAK